MVPLPGELFDDRGEKAGYAASGYEDVFYHDVPPELAAEARRRGRDETAKALREPWPRRLAGGADALPAVAATTGCSLPPGRRATPASASASRPMRWPAATTWMLSRPRELAERLDAYAEAVP